MVWNVAEEAVVFVGMDCFKDRLDILLPEMQRSTPDVGIERRLDWAQTSNQPWCSSFQMLSSMAASTPSAT
eukprot:3458823-Prymnesium_polylepis.1